MQLPEVFQFQQSCTIERLDTLENRPIAVANQVSLPQPVFLLPY